MRTSDHTALVQPGLGVSERRRRLIWLSALGGGYGLFALFARRHPLPVFCPFRRLTGHRCPFCGLTTATGLLLRGDLAAAQRAHPLILALSAAAAAWWGRQLHVLWRADA